MSSEKAISYQCHKLSGTLGPSLCYKCGSPVQDWIRKLQIQGAGPVLGASQLFVMRSLNILVSFASLVATSTVAYCQPALGSVLWSYDTGGSVRSSPALAPDGTIYLATGDWLTAITNSGSTASNRWTFAAGSSSGSPAVALDGTVYCGSLDGNLYAINPDGSQKWAYEVGAKSESPAIGFDGTVYMAGYGYVYALTPSGGLKWRSPTILPNNTYASAIVGPEGTVYVASYDSAQFYAFSTNGTQKWVLQVPTGAADSSAMRGDVVYTVASYLLAITSEGSNLWSFGSFDGSPVIGVDGTIYARGFSDHWLYAVSPAGQVLWHTPGDGFLHSLPTSPAIDASGQLYYCASNSLLSISPKGQITSLVYDGGGPADPPRANTSPVIGPDGTIYAALGRTLYAVYGTNGLADSAWPMYRQNARHTGKIEKASLRAPGKRADANFQFQLYGQIGQTQMVQTSTDLVTWTSATNVAVTNVPVDVVDLSASNAQMRFYRTRSQ
jgi:outer membrane protein assembly factor BamB